MQLPPASVWDPGLYERFKGERTRPFLDLLRGTRRADVRRAVDLGCGTGRLTAVLAEELRAEHVLGIDGSDSMLERAPSDLPPQVELRHERIEDHAPEEPYDLVFSNAALHWLEDHDGWLARFAGWLAPGGQLAIQVPANHDHPSQTLAAEVAREEPFAAALGGFVRRSPVLAPERYTEILHRLGFARIDVRLQVYAHLLPRTDAVVDWVRGTTLTAYEERMTPDLYASFLERYRDVIAERLPREEPYLFTFKRVLMWADRSEAAE